MDNSPLDVLPQAVRLSIYSSILVRKKPIRISSSDLRIDEDPGVSPAALLQTCHQVHNEAGTHILLSERLPRPARLPRLRQRHYA